MKIIFTSFSLLFFLFAHAQITLVKDINAGSADASNPLNKCVYNGYVYFAASTGVSLTNRELWRSDGTDAGTTLVKDINPVVNASGNPSGMIVFNNALFFNANDGVNGTELWTSDGTSAGTVMLKDIVSGANSSQPANFTLFNNALYFTVTNNADSKKSALWKTDGTSGGTVLVKDINTITQTADIGRLKVSSTKLFFWAITDAEGREPWVSDGTTAGTNLIKDIFTGSTGSPGPTVDYDFTPDGNGTVYFKAAGNTALTDRELWKSDGTALGTVLVKDIYPGTNTSELDGGTKLMLNGILYFSATDPNLGKELWRSDGTAVGTYMVKDIYPGAFLSSEAFIIGAAGNTIFLQATTPTYLRELWKSDGTDAGTSLVKDIYPGLSSGTPGNNSSAFSVGNSLLFQATTSSTGIELWKTDGTDAGTTMIQDLQLGTTGTNPNSFIVLGSTILFNDNPTSTNVELYKLDLTVLPLKWLSFSASENRNKQVALNWKVTDEININGYEVEWSTDAVHFKTIESINYNVQTKGNYSAIHVLPAKGSNYYRIKQIDTDGKFSYTPIQSVRLADKISISVYPNPSSTELHIVGWNTIQQMQLYNISGKKMYEWQSVQSAIPLHQLSNGTYILNARLKNGETFVQKIVVSR
jgi:ELWxxDGT repeat protein